MATHHLEVERKYELADLSTPVPIFDWSQLNKLSIQEVVKEHLEATYFDTAEQVLGKNMVALRRRVGGYDQGWHIKFDDGNGSRHEVHYDLLADHKKIPAAVERFVRSAIQKQPLIEIVSLVTDRERTVVQDDSGVAVAEICADSVVAFDFASKTERTWKEWEVELLHEGSVSAQEIFESCEEIFENKGIVPSRSVAKIARALGKDSDFENRRLGRSSQQSATNGKKKSKKKKKEDLAPVAGSHAVLRSVLDNLSSELLLSEMKFRAGAFDSVHGLRQTTRRLESVLRYAARPYVRAEADALEIDACIESLKKLAKELSAARDIEIVREYLTGVGPQPGVVSQTALDDLGKFVTVDEQDTNRSVQKLLDAEEFMQLGRALKSISVELDQVVDLPLNAENYVNKVAKRIRKLLTGFYKDELKELWKSETTEFAYDELNNEPLFRLRRAAQSGRYCMEAFTNRGVDLTAQQRILFDICTDLHREISVLSDEHVVIGWLESASRRASRRQIDRLGIGYLMGRSSFYMIGLRMTHHSFVPAELKSLKGLNLK